VHNRVLIAQDSIRRTSVERSSHADQTERDCPRACCTASSGAKALGDLGEMKIYGRFADRQYSTDFPRCFANGSPSQNFSLTL
jgi:hypothetical protein